MVKSKFLTIALALSTTVLLLPTDNASSLVMAKEKDTVQRFLEKDVNVLDAQTRFLSDSGFYEAISERGGVEGSITFIDRPEWSPKYWNEIHTLNEEIQGIYTSIVSEGSYEESMSLYEEELMPKLETLLGFIESGEKEQERIIELIESDDYTSELSGDEIETNQTSSYQYASDYFDGLRLMVYAYQELYKFEKDTSVNKQSLTLEQKEKLTELNHYLSISELMNAYLFH